MKAARRVAKKKKPSRRAASGTKAAKVPLPVHLHVENSRDMSAVFEATPERVKAALARHPRLKGKVKVTIGYDGDIYAEAMRTAQVLFGWNFDRLDLARKAPHLRWVHAHGAGVSHLMPLDWLPAGAVLTNSRGVHGPRADEYTLMAILMINNNLPRMASNQRAARWEQLFNSSIQGKTLLIVGVGHVGGGAAKWARRLGMRVIGIRRTGRPHPQVHEMHKPAALSTLLPRADIVLITTPHTADTRHLIGRRELDLMKRGAGLVNYSRAQLVDYDALAEKLREGVLSAVLDVFDPEPLPSSSPLWSLPNLIITPHCSSDDTELYTPKTLDLVCRNIERLIGGKALLNQVSPKFQY
ncbi:MAG TPA: D-2-hydroxyacid dehydrogenase [Stellaceae bacterium]|nr:D-2-hydroxyacid dehydrogenase [Stellaceae bacterium]